MKTKTWQWWETLLWAYSCIYIILLLIIMASLLLDPNFNQAASSTAAASNYTPSAPMVIWIVLTLPVLFFLVREGIKNFRAKTS
jgi:hypothetical protein